MRATVAEGGQLIVRRGLTACRIVDKDGSPFDATTILDLARHGTASGGIVDTPVWLPASDDWAESGKSVSGGERADDP